MSREKSVMKLEKIVFLNVKGQNNASEVEGWGVLMMGQVLFIRKGSPKDELPNCGS